MGENEQGGMLRTVVVIGIVAMVALIITLGVVGLKNNVTKNQTNALQTVSKGVTQKDIDFTMTGTNGKLDKVVSHTDLINDGYFPNVLSGNDKNNDTSFKFVPYGYDHKGTYKGTSDGMRAELYLNLNKINYALQDSNSDYLELSIDYTIKNAKSLTYDQASALNLDSRRIDGGFSGLQIGLRSDSYDFRQNKILNMNGDMSGTLTLQAPKSTIGSTYEAYIILANMNFDSVKLSNLRISNASH